MLQPFCPPACGLDNVPSGPLLGQSFVRELVLRLRPSRGLTLPYRLAKVCRRSAQNLPVASHKPVYVRAASLGVVRR